MSARGRAAVPAAFGGRVALGVALVGTAALSSALMARDPASAQEATPGAAPRDGSGAPVEDEIVVLGRIGTLRHDLEIAEDAMFERFNQIVGDPRLEIHCRIESKIDSHITQRVCASNSWREENANIAQTLLGEVRGETGAPPQLYNAEQLLMQQRLRDAMRRLATEDPQLHDAILRVGKAQDALAEQTGAPAVHSVSRELEAGEAGLPFNAKRAFEGRVGQEPWYLDLTQRTFTLGAVTGEIRALRVKCDQGNKRIDYKPDVDWTLPGAWRDCALRVDAKPGTTFVLYEFE